MISRTLVVAALSLVVASAFAQAPAAATAPAGSTGLCKDGSYSTNATKKGACNGHKGVKEWYAAAAAPAPAPAPAPAATSAAVLAPAVAAAPAAKAAAKTAMPTVAAAGGGAGQVWVNAGGSKVYHCMGSKYYGKTKEGAYMTEAAAKAAGNHANHGKACAA